MKTHYYFSHRSTYFNPSTGETSRSEREGFFFVGSRKTAEVLSSRKFSTKQKQLIFANMESTFINVDKLPVSLQNKLNKFNIV